MASEEESLPVEQDGVESEFSGFSQPPGDDGSALVYISEQILQKLQLDRRFVRLAVALDMPRAVEQVCGWIHHSCIARGLLEPTDQFLSADLLEGPAFEDWVEVLLETMRKPVPLGEDVLGLALNILGNEMREDPRVTDFVDTLAPPAPSTFTQFSSAANATFKSLERAASNLGFGRQISPQVELEELNSGDSGGSSELAEEDYMSVGGQNMALEDGGPMELRPSRSEDDINTQSLDQLVLEPDACYEIQRTWTRFMELSGSREAAGKLVFDALFDGAPSLQVLFPTPRVIQASRFVNALQGLVDALQEPAKLRGMTEILGFSHMNMDISLPRVMVFRNNLVETMRVELGEEFNEFSRNSWYDVMNYVGGALIFVKSHYSTRLQTLMESWAQANDMAGSDAKARRLMESSSESLTSESKPHSNNNNFMNNHDVGNSPPKGKKSWKQLGMGGKNNNKVSQSENANSNDSTNDTSMGGPSLSKQAVPTTFNEMFEVNAAVMGFSRNGPWFREVLRSFDSIVCNAVNAVRLQEECDILALRISKIIVSGQVNLNEFKSCMLAALGSLLPKTWDSRHEVAWSWLWENVERLLLQTLGKPATWESKVAALMGSLEEDQKRDIRQKIYDRFFELAPTGQDYFKQSSTRLHYIAGRVMEMTVDLYKEPWRMVEVISAVGLRHVGYGVPTELFGPFLTSHIEVMQSITNDTAALEAYQWSLSLIVKILIRNINEGSTIVMKAINANSVRMLKHALAQAPRSKRVEWLLMIQVGPCKISPLEWAIESGSFEVANAAIEDLLTIRADRDKYYFGVDELFRRHPDFVFRLCDEAPTLLTTLLEGLVWRSRQTKNGVRRVNYFVKHLIINEDGGLSDALRALAASKDQTIISHPVVVLVSDTLWTGVIRRSFFLSKLGFIFSVLVFMVSQAILPKAGMENSGVRISILAGRILTYGFSLGRLLFSHMRQTWQSYREGRTMRVWRVPIPRYLRDTYKALGMSLVVLLVGMFAHEPMLFCFGQPDWPTEVCPGVDAVEWRYTMLSMVAMAIHWLLLVDMAAFSTKLQAFLLVFRHVMSELGRFLVAMIFLLSTFSSAIACLRHGKEEFRTIPSAANCLFAITVGLYEGDYREMTDQPWLLIAVFLFVTVSTVLLINLLIAQLNCSYEYVYQDMVGFARLARAQLIVETLASCPAERWNRFVETLRLDQPIEFDEGDVGLAGGIQVRELASLHPSAEDSIQRFGGSCTPEMPWPEPEEEEDRIERVERLIHAAYKMAGKLYDNDGSGGDQGGSHSSMAKPLSEQSPLDESMSDSSNE